VEAILVKPRLASVGINLRRDVVLTKDMKINIEWRIFLLSILLGVIVWLFDCWVDAYFFSERSLLEQIFKPEIFELYMRGLILLVFIGFGIVVSKVVLRLRQSEEEKARTIANL